MSETPSVEEKYTQYFMELAELVNQQPPGERQRARRLIGEFLHDIKHTLGLISGANTVLERELKIDDKLVDSLEMLEIANHATEQIDAYIDLLSDKFASKIDASEEE